MTVRLGNGLLHLWCDSKFVQMGDVVAVSNRKHPNNKQPRSKPVRLMTAIEVNTLATLSAAIRLNIARRDLLKREKEAA